MKIRIAIICLCLIVVAFVSCGGGETRVQIDVSKELNKEFQISRNTMIDLVSMDPNVLYAVNSSALGSSSRALVEDAYGTGTKAGLLELVLGHYLAVPDEDNSCTFTGSEAGIGSSSGYASIVQFRNSDSDDLTIRSGVDPVSYYNEGGETVYEEYYHVDFSKAPFNSLDRSRIVLYADTHVEAEGYNASNPSYGYVTTKGSFLKKSESIYEVYDFSGYDFVNLFFTYAFYSSDPSASFETSLRIANPVNCGLNSNHNVGGEETYYYFSPVSGCHFYVIEIDQDNLYGPTPSHLIIPTKTNGSLFDDVYSFDRNRILVHDPSEDVYFSLAKAESEAKLSVCVREATEEEIQKYYDSKISVNSKSFEMTINDVGVLSDELIYDPITEQYVPAYVCYDSFRFEPASGISLNDVKVSVDIVYDDGSYGIGRGSYLLVKKGLKNPDTGGTNGALGSHSEVYVENFFVLDSLKFNLMELKPFSVRIRIEKAVDPLKNSSEKHHLYFIPNNGDSIQDLQIPIHSAFTIPHLENAGKEYLGMMFDGHLYKEGEQLNYMHSDCGITAVWR